MMTQQVVRDSPTSVFCRIWHGFRVPPPFEKKSCARYAIDSCNTGGQTQKQRL